MVRIHELTNGKMPHRKEKGFTNLHMCKFLLIISKKKSSYYHPPPYHSIHYAYASIICIPPSDDQKSPKPKTGGGDILSVVVSTVEHTVLVGHRDRDVGLHLRPRHTRHKETRVGSLYC